MVIPVYNEERRIAVVMEEVFRYLEGCPFTYEVIVVDDGSTDDSARILSESRRPQLSVLRLKENQGKGAAVRQGMLRAKGRVRMFRDADCSTSMEQLERFLPYFEKNEDIVIGCRKMESSLVVRRQPWLRETLGRGFTWICRRLILSQIRDYTCGFKCFSARASDAIFPKQLISRWAFDAEILYLAGRSGFSIVQVPVVWSDEAGTKVRMWMDVPRSFLEIILIRWYSLTGRYGPSVSR